MMEDRHRGVLLDLNWSHVSFQFFQKCPNIDLTLTACLAEIEMKFQYAVPYLVWCTSKNRNRNSLNKHFTSKTYGDELVFDQIN